MKDKLHDSHCKSNSSSNKSIAKNQIQSQNSSKYLSINRVCNKENHYEDYSATDVKDKDIPINIFKCQSNNNN